MFLNLHIIFSAARSFNCQVNNTQIIPLCFSLNHVVVKDFVVGICNRCTFLVFHEFEIKYSVGV